MNHLAVLRKSASGANVLSQKVRHLKPGHAYTLHFISANYYEMRTLQRRPHQTGIRAFFGDGDVEAQEERLFVDRNLSRNSKSGVVNVHRIDFVPLTEEITLSFTDEFSNGNPEEELGITFIQIKERFIPEEVPSSALTSCCSNSESHLSTTEFTILHSSYMQKSLVAMLTKSSCIAVETQKSRDAFASSFVNFYHYGDVPRSVVDAERELLQGEGEESFEKVVKSYCRKELWFFADTAYTDFIATLETHPEIRAITNPIGNWNEWLGHFEMCDQFCQYVLEEEYGIVGSDKSQGTHKFVEDAGKSIECCRQAFAKALAMEEKRCGGKERIDPVFFLVCGARAPSGCCRGSPPLRVTGASL